MANACNICKENGFDNQPITIKPDIDMVTGKQKTYNWNGAERPSWIKLNPDGSVHEHKKQPPASPSPPPTTTTTIPTSTQQQQQVIAQTQAQAQPKGTFDPAVNMSESQKASVEGYIDEKQEYYKQRQEERDKKYDDNIKEYKQWQDDILKEAKYQSTILEDIFTSQKEMAQDIKDMLRILGAQTQEPTIQKASELVNNPYADLKGPVSDSRIKSGPKSSQEKQEEAFEHLDETLDEAAKQIIEEKEKQQEEEEEEGGKGYPE